MWKKFLTFAAQLLKWVKFSTKVVKKIHIHKSTRKYE